MTGYKPTILIVEDEKDVLRINARMLKRRGYDVITAENCSEAYKKLEETKPDLLLLDIMLPDGSGHDICSKFRKTSEHPVVFLSGKNEISDKVEGLGIGADYYLTKPYSFDELLAVVERLLSRHKVILEKHEQMSMLQRGRLSVDIQKGCATLDGCDIGLTRKEFSMLLFLMQNEGKEISAHELYEKVWGVPSANDTRTVRKHIFNLRAKIEADCTDDYDIVSVYGKGYCFRCD